MSDDPFNLQRFVDAQEDATIYARALGELRAGRKQGHWIWFVFPQIAGLGSSPMSLAYAILSLDEARAYLAHPVLGPRLHECTEALLAADPSASAEQILGGIDAIKVRSSMTLFHRAAPEEQPFASALTRFYSGLPDPETDRLLVGE
ncbi:MAG TPA: DUF1810 domain-containing protein [Solirubrobacterales bacterium]|jgi:uncharacterized protein (DUF1810 family)|nr:DUF1810 domain-containing protein [Solirubrobacterales bacterium]